MSGCEDTMEHRRQAVLDRFFTAWNGRDVGHLIALKGTNRKVRS
jgi:hypothetical protein